MTPRVSDEVLRRELSRLQQRIDVLETMVEDRSREVFLANQELREVNATLEQKVAERTAELSMSRDQLKASLDEQQEMQRVLLETSRKAGMAEVATTVLHNVGNVLNSVNVSADTVASLVRSSRGAGLRKAVDLLRAQPEPGRFLTEDARGKKLIEYLEVVAQTVDDERKRMIEEIDSLTKNIEHIKVIVTTQQSQQKERGGITERLSLPGLDEPSVQRATCAQGMRRTAPDDRAAIRAPTSCGDPHRGQRRRHSR